MTQEMTYDSRIDTLVHIKRVNELILKFCSQLLERATQHDNSKLESPEKEKFDEETPKLKSLIYGSDEYKESLARLGSALTHHYKYNSHHPEHWPNGIDDMSLFDVVEMFLDWKASSERTVGGTLNLGANKERFKVSQQLHNIFKNTLDRMYL